MRVVTARANRMPFAIQLLVVHLFVVASFGQYYAKVRIPIDGVPIYATDVVLMVGLLASLGALAKTTWDASSKVVLLFTLVGIGWVGAAGLGPMNGVGPKAFSFFVYSGFYFIVRAAAPPDAVLWRMLRVFVFASVIAVVLGIFQMRTGAPVFGSAEFETTTTGSVRWLPGEFTLYALVSGLVIAVPAIVEKRIDARRAVLLAVVAVELVLTQQRSGFLSLAVALLATAWFLGSSAEALKGLFKLLVACGVGLVLFVWVFGSGYIDETINRIAHTSDISDANVDWRLLSWYEVLDGIADRPWGHGFATWDFMFTWNDPLTGSHNSFLDLAYRIGVEGLLVFIAMPVLLVRDVRRRVRETSARSQLLLVSACAAMIAFLLFSMFNVVFETPQLSVLFWVLLGIGAVVVERGRQRSDSTNAAGTPSDDAVLASDTIALRHEAGESGPSRVTT
jgi:O-antigen ligase